MDVDYLVRLELDANDYTLKIDGTTRVGPATDASPITGNLRTGIRTYVTAGGAATRLDEFEAGDLGAVVLTKPVWPMASGG